MLSLGIIFAKLVMTVIRWSCMLKPYLPVKAFWLGMLCVFLSGLSSAQVRRELAAHDNICGRSHLDEEVVSQPREIQEDIGPRFRLPCGVDDMAGFAALDASELYNHIVSVDDPLYCINRIIYTYHTDYSKIIFDDAKVRYIADVSLTLINNYDGINDNGTLGLFIYLSIAGLQGTFYPDDVNLSPQTWASIKTACKALANNPNVGSETENSYYTLAHMFFAASFEDIAADEDIIALAKTMLDDIANDSYIGQTNLYPYYYCYYYIFDLFFRYPTERSPYLDEIVMQKDIITSLGEVAINTSLNPDTFEFFGDLSNLSVVAISRHAPHESLQDVVVPALNKVADTYDEFSSNWFVAANSLIRNDLGFDRTEEELRSELETITFPNNFHFEDGKFQIATSLDYSEAIALYQSALEVRAQFFRMLEDESPVRDDTNDTLYIKVYDNRANYRDFNGLLFGVNYPNSGGVYIEAFSTFYTYDRGPEESAYSLEELFRHEYTHYLQGRYIVPGGWGQAPFYDNSRLVWFEEGMAQFFAAATRTEGVKALQLIKNTIVNDRSRDGLNKILSSSYSSGDPDAYYIYGAMLWTYWYEEDRGRFQELLKLIREEDLSSFDDIIDYYKTNEAEEERFFAFIDSLIAVESPWIVQETTRELPQNMSISRLHQIKQEVESILPDLDVENCIIEAAEDPRQFRISGNVLVGQTTESNTQSALILNESLDDILTELSASTANNFQYTTAYYDDPRTGSGTTTTEATFHIYGPLGEFCEPVAVEDFTTESFNNRVRFHVPEYVDLQHQFRYRVLGSNQWFEIIANAVSPDIVFNIDPELTYELQMRQECSVDVWSEYSESKYFMLCPDDRSLSGVVSGDQLFQAAYTLSSTQNITNGGSAVYRASNEIEFSTNFTVHPGGSLEVNMENCQDPN